MPTVIAPPQGKKIVLDELVEEPSISRAQEIADRIEDDIVSSRFVFLVDTYTKRVQQGPNK